VTHPLKRKLEHRGIWQWMPELSVVLALLTVVGGIWLFVEITEEVMEDQTRDADHAILQAMRSAENPKDPWGPRWVELAAEDLTAMGSYTPMFVILFAVAGYLALIRQWGNTVLILVAVLAGLGLNHFLKDWFDRGRPEIVPHLVDVSTKSFPSGHAMMSAVVYLTLGALLAQASDRWRVKLFVMGLAVFLTLAIGTTRVYLGVHYPSDVLAGWSVGLAWAALTWLVAWVIRRRGRLLERRPLGER
jgi:undecaprenyl-diphosphatase